MFVCMTLGVAQDRVSYTASVALGGEVCAWMVVNAAGIPQVMMSTIVQLVVDESFVRCKCFVHIHCENAH